MDRSQQYRSVIHQVLNDYYRLYSQSERSEERRVGKEC